MPDTEMFKLIVNGGSFAMLILIGCWALFRLEPRIRDMLEKKDAVHAEVIQKAITAFGDSTQKIASENRQLLESIAAKYTVMIENSAKECREERKEWMETVQREGDLNRKARHDLANQIQTMIAEAYNVNRDRLKNGE